MTDVQLISWIRNNTVVAKKWDRLSYDQKVAVLATLHKAEQLQPAVAIKSIAKIKRKTKEQL